MCRGISYGLNFTMEKGRSTVAFTLETCNRMVNVSLRTLNGGFVIGASTVAPLHEEIGDSGVSGLL